MRVTGRCLVCGNKANSAVMNHVLSSAGEEARRAAARAEGVSEMSSKSTVVEVVCDECKADEEVTEKEITTHRCVCEV